MYMLHNLLWCRLEMHARDRFRVVENKRYVRHAVYASNTNVYFRAHILLVFLEFQNRYRFVTRRTCERVTTSSQRKSHKLGSTWERTCPVSGILTTRVFLFLCEIDLISSYVVWHPVSNIFRRISTFHTFQITRMLFSNGFRRQDYKLWLINKQKSKKWYSSIIYILKLTLKPQNVLSLIIVPNF